MDITVQGESFSISDPNEVWIMEIIGKGTGNKGAVWVALQSARRLCMRTCQPVKNHYISFE